MRCTGNCNPYGPATDAAALNKLIDETASGRLKLIEKRMIAEQTRILSASKQVQL